MASVGAPRDADSFYVQDCRQVQKNTHDIQTVTGQISRLVGTLENEKDYMNCRQMVDDAVKQASETRTILARIKEHQNQAQNAAEKNNRRMMHQKLSDNLAITARVLEDVVKRFQAEERKRGGHMEDLMRKQAVTGGGDEAGGEHDRPLLDMFGDGDQIHKEKRPAFSGVDEDMRCLQTIYTELATASDQQQEHFDAIECHIQGAAHDLERGRHEIQAMGKYGWARHLKNRTVAIGGGVLAFVAVTVFFTSS